MRNKTLSLIALATLSSLALITSCKSKEPEKPESQQTIAFYAGDSAQINTLQDQSTNYVSANEFVASIKNDTAIANHVGTTTLTATSGLPSTANVTVIPRYRFFQEPITKWGIDTTELLEQMLPLKPMKPFCLDSVGARSMYGFLRLPNVEAVLFYFEDNKLALTWTLIPQKDSVLTHMQDFLLERYEYMNSTIEGSIWSDAMVHRYINAYSPKDADLIIAYHDMTLDQSAYLIEGMFGTRNLLGLLYQDAHMQQFDTAWVEQYINGLPDRIINYGK